MKITYINRDESQKHNGEHSPKQAKFNDILMRDANMLNRKENLDNDEPQVQDSSCLWVSREKTSKGDGHGPCSLSWPGC